MESEDTQLSIATFKSFMSNIKRSHYLLTVFFGKVGFIEPFKIPEETSTLVLNRLLEYYHIGTKDALSDGKIGALVQGRRSLYLYYGHKTIWTVDVKTGSAGGNHLIRNEDFNKLRSNHRMHNALLGRSKTGLRPLKMDHRCENSETYSINDCNETGLVDYWDVLLHSVLLIGMKLEIRFD